MREVLGQGVWTPVLNSVYDALNTAKLPYRVYRAVHVLIRLTWGEEMMWRSLSYEQLSRAMHMPVRHTYRAMMWAIEHGIVERDPPPGNGFKRGAWRVVEDVDEWRCDFRPPVEFPAPKGPTVAERMRGC